MFLVQECADTRSSCCYWRKSICIGLCIQLVVGSARSSFQLLDSYVFHVCIVKKREWETTRQKLPNFKGLPFLVEAYSVFWYYGWCDYGWNVLRMSFLATLAYWFSCQRFIDIDKLMNKKNAMKLMYSEFRTLNGTSDENQRLKEKLHFKH